MELEIACFGKWFMSNKKWINSEGILLTLDSKFFLFYKNEFSQLVIETATGELVDRVSPWATYVTQCKESKLYQMIFYNPIEVILIIF